MHSQEKLPSTMHLSQTERSERVLQIHDFTLHSIHRVAANGVKAQIGSMLSRKNIEDCLRYCTMLRASGFCDQTTMGAIMLQSIIFMDASTEELYTQPNTQNTCARTNNAEPRISINISKNGLGIMVASGMSGTGPTKLHIIDAGATAYGDYCRRCILPVYLETT